jgi:hypothetical protein
MTWPLLALRSLAMIAHAVWLGGFTFYGAVVIPILHEEYGSLDGGLITGRVSDRLNALGVGTVALWWFVAWVDRRRGPALARRLRLGLLAMTTALLSFLVVDHEILDARLATSGLTGFYGDHRIYLIASTIQWAANLGLVPVALAIWLHRPDESRPT